MLIRDRVLCDECLCPMGQLHHLPVDYSDHFTDCNTAPDYCVCPDCAEAIAAQGDNALPAGD